MKMTKLKNGTGVNSNICSYSFRLRRRLFLIDTTVKSELTVFPSNCMI